MEPAIFLTLMSPLSEWTSKCRPPPLTGRSPSAANHGHWEIQAHIPIPAVNVKLGGEVFGQSKVNISIARSQYPVGIHSGAGIYLSSDIARAGVKDDCGDSAVDLKISVSTLDV
jgi:hypothetical protein